MESATKRRKIRREHSTKKKKAIKTRIDTSAFGQAFIDDCKARIKRMEELDLDKPDRTFSKSMRQELAIVCLARLSLDALSNEKKAEVLAAAEKICREFGYSFFDKKSYFNEY